MFSIYLPVLCHVSHTVSLGFLRFISESNLWNKLQKTYQTGGKNKKPSKVEFGYDKALF